jgi:peptidylprolyl isomerase/FKBP-type peptidyl-prolyl cis-trans isomerase FklB
MTPFARNCTVVAAGAALAVGFADVGAAFSIDVQDRQSEFLSTNAKRPDVQIAPAMQYRILRAGPADGKHPTRSSAVKLLYEGRRLDGTLFDNNSGKPAIFPVRALTSGFQQALMMMKPGDVWEIWVPAELAYGQSGSPLSGQTLHFRIELIEWAEMPPPPPPFLPEMPKAR